MDAQSSRPSLHRMVSTMFALLALGLVLLAILWSPGAAELLSSRINAALLGGWSAAISILFHDEWRAGFAKGIREFRRSSKETADEISRSIGGDEDPPAAA